MKDKPFTIAKVSWLTNTVGNEDRRGAIEQHFHVVTKFLQDNGLTRRVLCHQRQDINDDFAIESGDLTDGGLAVMKLAYDRWVKQVDRGMNPSNVALLDNALARVRAAER